MRAERMGGLNPFDLVYVPGCVPFPAEWTVKLWERPEWRDFAVQAVETHTGAVVPALGPYVCKSLARARKEAARLLGVVLSAPIFPLWKPSEERTT